MDVAKKDIDKALERIKQLGGIDYSFLANCRPDVELAGRLWNDDTYRIKDLEKSFSHKRLFYFPLADLWLVLTDEYEDNFKYIDEYSGLTEEQYAMFLLPYATEKYASMSEDDFQQTLMEYNSRSVADGSIDDLFDDDFNFNTTSE